MAAAAFILSPDEAIQRLCRDLVRPARLLVAVSGGSDSTGLLVSLSKAAREDAGITLFAATVDHALRPESADEAKAVLALCVDLGIPHVTRRWEGAKPATGVSAAAREARYRLLLEVADEVDATAILTGHTLDDQAETVTMRAARSEAEDGRGLAGMAEAVLLDRRRWLVRPFLRTRRADIRAWLASQGQGWIEDPSNLDSHYERVRVRGKLTGQGSFDPGQWLLAVERRTSLSDAAAMFLRDHVTIRHGVLARLSPEGLKTEAALRRHALSLLAAVLGGRTHALGADSLERVMAFVESGQSGRVTAGRVIFDLRRDGLYFVRENRGMLPLHIRPSEADIWDGRYRIDNGCPQEIVVGPTAPDREEASTLFPDVPPAIAMRAASAMPHIEAALSFPPDERNGEIAASLSEKTSAAGIDVEPVLAPFDRFLPQFDLRLGSEIAVLLGCDVFPPLPIKDSARKS